MLSFPCPAAAASAGGNRHCERRKGRDSSAQAGPSTPQKTRLRVRVEVCRLGETGGQRGEAESEEEETKEQRKEAERREQGTRGTQMHIYRILHSQEYIQGYF